MMKWLNALRAIHKVYNWRGTINWLRNPVAYIMMNGAMVSDNGYKLVLHHPEAVKRYMDLRRYS